MTKEEKQNYINAKTIGYWSALNGMEVKAVEDDHVVVVENAWASGKKVHRLLLRYSLEFDDYYIMLGGGVWWLKDCIKA